MYALPGLARTCQPIAIEGQRESGSAYEEMADRVTDFVVNSIQCREALIAPAGSPKHLGVLQFRDSFLRVAQQGFQNVVGMLSEPGCRPFDARRRARQVEA